MVINRGETGIMALAGIMAHPPKNNEGVTGIYQAFVNLEYLLTKKATRYFKGTGSVGMCRHTFIEFGPS